MWTSFAGRLGFYVHHLLFAGFQIEFHCQYWDGFECASVCVCARACLRILCLGSFKGNWIDKDRTTKKDKKTKHEHEDTHTHTKTTISTQRNPRNTRPKALIFRVTETTAEAASPFAAEGYHLVFCGHSMGGAVSAMCAAILRDKAGDKDNAEGVSRDVLFFASLRLGVCFFGGWWFFPALTRAHSHITSPKGSSLQNGEPNRWCLILVKF